MAALILTVSAPDRPGLVNLLAGAVSAAGGNWLESRLVRLAGKFAGVVLVSLPDDLVAVLADSIVALADQGLRVVLEPAEPFPAASVPPRPRVMLSLDLVGHDRPGIVRELTDVLARRGINIEAFETAAESASFSGDILFRAHVVLSLPEGETQAALKSALEALGNDLMVDIALAEDAA